MMLGIRDVSGRFDEADVELKRKVILQKVY